MKKLRGFFVFIVLVYLFNPITAQAGWVTLTTDNFETGWGSYTSGGVNAVIYTYSSGTNYAHQGSKAADIQSIGTTSLFTHTNGINLDTPGYTQLKIDFWFYAVGMEDNEDFWVQYSSDGGTNWSTVATYVIKAGSELVNNTFYNKTVIISESSYPFTNNAKIRFRCDASSTSDDVYIDEIVVSGYTSTLSMDMDGLGLFVERWLDSGCGPCSGADLSGDGDVDFEDFAFFALSWLVDLSPATVVINEFMASNDTTIADSQGEYDDWIEIYNYGTETVDMGGMFIADDSTLWEIPDGVTLNAGSYLLIWADDAGAGTGLHANFKLSADGDQVRLFKANGVTLIDGITFGEQTTDISYGRYPDGGNDWYDMNEPTPGAANKAGMAGEVWFSRLSGTFTSNFSLTLATASPTATIRYTTDGSIPTASSTLYSSPISITTSQTRIIRARAYQSGLAPGLVTSQTYLPLAADVQNFTSNLPIVIVDTAGFDIDTENDPYTAWPFRNVCTAFIDTNDTGRASVKDLSDFAGRGGLKVRGDSSASDWMAASWARQYSFETWDENNDNLNVSILGFPPESKWILHIPFDDKSLMRNVLAFEWSNTMGNYASRTKYVELFLNKDGDNVAMEDYWGIYILMEKIKVDDGRVDIAKLKPSDNNEPEISGGYILKHDKNSLGDPTFTTTQNKTGAFQYQDPTADELTTQQKAWIKGYLDQLETALYGGSYTDPVNGYAKYMDVNTFVDFFWMVEIAKQVDSYVYSTYMHKDRNGKLKMGPAWDFNIAFGNAGPTPGQSWYFYWQRETPGWYYAGDGLYNVPGGTNVWYNRLREDAEYKLKCADRWFELREDRLNDANIVADINYHYNLLSAEAAARHFNRWQLYVDPDTGMEVGSGGVWASILNAWTWPNWYYGTPNDPHTYQMEVEWTKNWLTGLGTPAPGETYEPLYTDRVGWMDNNIGYAFPPNFSVGGVQMNKGGHVSSGSNLTMAGSTGTIYYTLDGSDPRQPFTGNAVGTAYTGSITLNASVQVKARIKNVSAWSALNEATFAVGPVAENLRVTEIMYHPEDTGSPDDPNTEFIELKNIGASAINLSLVKFTNGIEFTFPNMSLAAGQYVLVVKDQAAFEDKYTAGYYIAGQYTGSLSNGGEEIDLKDAVGEEILDFEYEDGWYPITDGNDFTLNIINPADPEPNSWDLEESWQASNVKGGSPGAAYTSNVAANGAIVINEVLTHTDNVVDGDWIELRNTTGASINIGGWFLSDNAGNFRKYEIAAGTTIPANGYKVFTAAANFDNSGDAGSHVQFGLSELGETVYFSSGLAGQLSGGYSIKEGFGAASKEVTFGRYTKSAAAGYDVDFVAMASATKGTANSGPLVPNVVINEIMYNSATQYDRLAEYIELYNRSGSTVKLYDPNNPSNTWKFTNGIDFTFPAGVTLGSGKYLLVSRCNPTIFRLVYSVPSDVNVFGPFENGTELANDGEKLELSKPETPEPDGYVPYIRVEQVNYSDGSHPLGSDPWPMSPDGHGDSLGREVPASYGNDVDNWEAVTPSPGVVNP